jgi:hypothetical protein
MVTFDRRGTWNLSVRFPVPCRMVGKPQLTPPKLEPDIRPDRTATAAPRASGVDETFTLKSGTPGLTVVGEVADAKLTSPDADASEQFYQPVAQLEKDAGRLALPTDLNGNGGYMVLRSALPPEQLENVLRATVRSIDVQLPLTQVQTMEQVVSQSEAPRRFNTIIISSFALAAVLLAVLGIYSIIAFPSPPACRKWPSAWPSARSARTLCASFSSQVSNSPPSVAFSDSPGPLPHRGSSDPSSFT